jgi:hypothetical protein
MENIADKLEEIKNQTDSEKSKFEQLSKFEDTIKNLQKILTIEKPTYSFPQVDTIGKQTYTSLNKK